MINSEPQEGSYFNNIFLYIIDNKYAVQEVEC